MTETVLVTGSSRGIGKAVALRLAQSGFDIVLHCLASRTAVEAVAEDIKAMGRDARILQFDIADRALAEKTLLDDIEKHGRSEEHTSELQSRPHLVCRLL